MKHLQILSRVTAAGVALGLLGLTGCKGKVYTPRPPRHSVALVAPVRGDLTVRSPDAKIPTTVDTDHRVESGSQLTTGPHGKATLTLDAGGWFLLDRATRVTVTAKGIKLLSGRVWVDAHGTSGVTVTTYDGTVTGAEASYDMQTGSQGTQVYCGSAEITLGAGKKTLRLVSGMVATMRGGKIDPQLKKIWDDWTGGMAQAGPRERVLAAGIGTLEARMRSEVGMARSSLLVRDHQVKAWIEGNLAVTRVEQHFFNPRSQVVEGRYRVRLPAGAIIRSFASGKKGQVQSGRIVPRSRKHGSPASNTVLEWEAPDRYVATLYPIGPGDTTVVRLEYVQWLHRKQGRRRYVYPMGGGDAPKLGEFALEVNVKRAGSRNLKAGMGAKREGDWVIVRRSDFRPRADFVLELLDRGAPKPVLYHAAAGRAKEPAYAALTLLAPLQPKLTVKRGQRPVRLVLVADVSAGMGTPEAALVRTVTDAILRQLTPEDQVALMVASVDALPLGKGLAKATLSHREGLLTALGKSQPGGGTDLEQALQTAARMLPKGLGSVIYIGDGRATLGTLAPGLLRDRLARRLTPPRLFAVGIGSGASMDLLNAVTDGLGFAAPVRDMLEAPRAALRIVAHAARPTLRNVTVDLGPQVDRVYPRRPVTVEDGTFLHVLGRLRGKPPNQVTLRGLRDGKPFVTRVAITHQKVSDRGDLRRRWAFARIQDLLRRGAGREAVAEVGVRYSVITPFSGMVVGSWGGNFYHSRLPEDPAGTFVPEALRGGPPIGRTTIALEPGWTTRTSRVIPLQALYRRVLHRKLWTAARASFDRKAASRPDLSGIVPVQMEVNPDGSVHKAELVAGAVVLKDPDVVEDVLRLVRSVQLPATPTGERFKLTHTFRFVPQDISDVPRRCLNKDGTRKRSRESYKYLDARRALWRERLYRNRSAVGAHRVWRGALACGEIRLDTDARALLLLTIEALGTTRKRVALYQTMRDELAWVRAFLRREILRRVRTLDDVRAVQGGLALDGGIDRALLAKMLKKNKKDSDKLKVVRRFLALSPESLSLRVMLMHLLERTGKVDEAERIAWKLRGDPAADAGVRQQVGEYFLRQGNRAEARRSFSELVEFAPYDPWARRRLGNLLLAQAAQASRAKGQQVWARRLYADAYREYETLAWLLPGDAAVLLLMANAAAGMERTDWALRLQQRVSEAAEVGNRGNAPAAWARLLTSVSLARMRLAAKDKALQQRLRARGRRAGIFTWARELSLIVAWAHPDARLQLWLRYPGQEKPERVALRGGSVGVEGIRLRRSAVWGAGARRPPDKRKRREVDIARTPLYLEIRCGDASPDRVVRYVGELMILWHEGTAKELVERRSLVFDPKTRALAFGLHPSGKITATKVVKP
jgi:tetratricopeptide (TPR) repeat protein